MKLAVIGAGPAGLALALLAAERLRAPEIHLFDTRPLDRDISGDARTLALKTALADLAAAYSGVSSARSAYEQTASAASDAAGAYAMGTGSKTDWYDALSARADSQTALYQAVGAFTRQANTLNELTGGWVSRTQGWLAEALLPLYDTSAQ